MNIYAKIEDRGKGKTTWLLDKMIKLEDRDMIAICHNRGSMISLMRAHEKYCFNKFNTQIMNEENISYLSAQMLENDSSWLRGMRGGINLNIFCDNIDFFSLKAKKTIFDFCYECANVNLYITSTTPLYV